MNFKDLPKEELIKISIKAGQANRSPELSRAWANASKIRKEYPRLGISQLADKYKVNVRSMQRIVKGK